MASRVFDVSSEMGQMLIQGWILTDKNCPNCGAPLMKSPRDTQPPLTRCVSCGQTQDALPSRPTSSSVDQHPVNNPSPSGSAQSGSALSDAKISTPPTELLSLPPSPGADAEVIPVLDTADILRRRAQSDRASSEIGRKMLQGWAMLADECPNSTCYGVPLVRPPRGQDGQLSKVKECVICGVDWGRPRPPAPTEPLPPVPSIITTPTRPPKSLPKASTESQPVATEAHQRYEISPERAPRSRSLRRSPTPEWDRPVLSLGKRRRDLSRDAKNVIEDAKDALLTTLRALSTRLNELSAVRPLPAKTISETVGAIVDTTRALKEVSDAHNLY